MWNFYLWKNLASFVLHKLLWMAVENTTGGCGEKVVAFLRQIVLFHISCYYYCEYYQNL